MEGEIETPCNRESHSCGMKAASESVQPGPVRHRPKAVTRRTIGRMIRDDGHRPVCGKIDSAGEHLARPPSLAQSEVLPAQDSRRRQNFASLDHVRCRAPMRQTRRHDERERQARAWPASRKRVVSRLWHSVARGHVCPTAGVWCVLDNALRDRNENYTLGSWAERRRECARALVSHATAPDGLYSR